MDSLVSSLVRKLREAHPDTPEWHVWLGTGRVRRLQQGVKKVKTNLEFNFFGRTFRGARAVRRFIQARMERGEGPVDAAQVRALLACQTRVTGVTGWLAWLARLTIPYARPRPACRSGS